MEDDGGRRALSQRPDPPFGRGVSQIAADSLQDKHKLSAADLRMHGPGSQAAITEASTEQGA